MKRGFVRLARLPDIGDGIACPRRAEERVESSPGLEKGNFCLGITSIAESATVLLLSRLWEKASVKSAGIGEGRGWGRSTCVSQEQNQSCAGQTSAELPVIWLGSVPRRSPGDLRVLGTKGFE